MTLRLDHASPPFDDGATTAFVGRHYEAVTRPLVESRGWAPVPVPVGREGNFVARDHNNRGQLGPDADRFTALCVAHSYGVMHYSEMLAFLRSCPEAVPRGPAAVIDIGCGIGSALAAINAMTGPGDHRWLAVDHNSPTLALARTVLEGVLDPEPAWAATLPPASHIAQWGGGRSVLVALSHVLGQRDMTDAALDGLADWLALTTGAVGEVTIVGVEPDRSGVVERGPDLFSRLEGRVPVTGHVDEVRELVRLETRSTAPIAPFVGPCRKRVRWYTLRR